MKNNCINLSSIFSKSTQPQIPSNSASGRDLVADVWSVILLKVDPYCIFKCILVCKEWLEVITSSFFRLSYQKKWKHRFPVIGFMGKYREIGLLRVTNKLGSLINKRKLMPISKFKFISKSSSGDGLILCADPEEIMYYVFNLDTHGGAIVTPLPPSPDSIYSLMEIISQDASFKVIMLYSVVYGEVTKVTIQTFRSSASMWEKSDHFCRDRFRFTGMPGIASSRGVVYWLADSCGLVAYDTNNNDQRECIRLIQTPAKWSDNIFSDRRIYLEVSSEGNLRCATTYSKVVKIWDLHEDEEDCEWKLLYMVDLMDLAAMRRFKFASFVPGRSHSIFLVSENYIFIYNGDTQVLERFEGAAPYWVYTTEKQIFSLTTSDFGVWPSSPFSNHPTPNKPRSFKLLGCV